MVWGRITSIPMDQLESEWEKRSADGGEFVDVPFLKCRETGQLI